MNEMVERVAKVICDAYTTTGFTGSMKQQLEMAKAAIEAMKEPTEDMISSAGIVKNGEYVKCYKAMIEAALK